MKTHRIRRTRIEHPNACIPSFLVDTWIQLRTHLLVSHPLQVLHLDRKCSVRFQNRRTLIVIKTGNSEISLVLAGH